jgi:hypothetical protein
MDDIIEGCSLSSRRLAGGGKERGLSVSVEALRVRKMPTNVKSGKENEKKSIDGGAGITSTI